MAAKLSLTAHNLHGSVPAGSVRYAHLQLHNPGPDAWTAGSADLSAILRIGASPVGAAALPRGIAAGEAAMISFGWRAPESRGTMRCTVELAVPPGARGQDRLLLDTQLTLSTCELDQTEQAMRGVFARGPWHWLPAGGVRISARGGCFPTLVASAKGARCRDADGREFVDWVMGWGSCPLGYTEPRIAAAVAESLATTSLTTLPALIETEVTERLCARFRGAEMVAFGKNGSDACTAAVRLARAFTGRDVVLHSGYHGWHDWYVDRRGLAGSGVPARRPPLVHAFATGDLAALDVLLAAHSGNVAAVMLEPAAQLESIDGPIRDADPEFLHAVADRCRRSGALLVFDEIFTAFRHAGGSVQQFVGIQPDLTCVGKALANGMPLSAVLGRRDVFSAAMQRVALDATYKGEPHSLAAARATLAIHDQVDVPGRIAAVARDLAAGIRASAARHGLDVEMQGGAMRMVPVFSSAGRDRVLWRTLLQQELLRRGVVTFRGLMLPSAAHGHVELRQTIAAFDSAFSVVRDAAASGRLLEQIEIPLVV